MSWLRRFVAWALSFRKREWSVRDYPLRVRRQEPGLPPWVADIDGWYVMTGLGDTAEEAIADLQDHLDGYRKEHGALPRPGTKVPIQFASREVTAQFEDLARDFFPPVIGWNYDECLITDESSVWDFPVDYDAKELARKVLLIFGTDITDLASEGNIAQILDRIAARRRGASNED